MLYGNIVGAMKITELEKVVSKFIKNDNNPVVIYASLWPFIKAFDLEPKSAPKIMLDLLLSSIDTDRSVLMPTFARGYLDGLCNLDTEPSTTGVLSEEFRKLPETKRTMSAFFSFNILGPQTSEVEELLPVDAWGDGSVYHWMECNNAHFIMLGIHPTHCSYLHRLEWLVREKINYRYVKTFQGKIIKDGKEHDLEENLFVRSLDPPVINDFTTLTGTLEQGGLNKTILNGVTISHVTAKQILESCLVKMQEDPFLVLQNRVAFEHG